MLPLQREVNVSDKLIVVTRYLRADQVRELSEIAKQLEAAGGVVSASELLRWCLDEGLEALRQTLPSLMDEMRAMR